MSITWFLNGCKETRFTQDENNRYWPGSTMMAKSDVRRKTKKDGTHRAIDYTILNIPLFFLFSVT